jgi:hypothetical protein
LPSWRLQYTATSLAMNRLIDRCRVSSSPPAPCPAGIEGTWRSWPVDTAAIVAVATAGVTGARGSDMLVDMRPESFDERYMTAWSEWVLDHGLPAMPETVRIGESVPVARWAGPRFGAVLHVQWNSDPDDVDEDNFISDVQVFDRIETGWRVYGAQGGTDWFDPPLERPSVDPQFAAIGGTFVAGEDGRACLAVEGLAGVTATEVEVVDRDGVLRRPIDSPLGVFIVALDAHADAVVSVIDTAGVVLASQSISGEVA